LRLCRAAFQVIEADKDTLDIVMKKAHLALLHPFICLGILAEMDMGKVVEALGAIKINEHLSAIRVD